MEHMPNSPLAAYYRKHFGALVDLGADPTGFFDNINFNMDQDAVDLIRPLNLPRLMGKGHHFDLFDATARAISQHHDLKSPAWADGIGGSVQFKSSNSRQYP